MGTCNCFGNRKKNKDKKSNEGDRGSSTGPDFEASERLVVTDDATPTTTGANTRGGQDTNHAKSNVTDTLTPSSPSRMATEDLTTIYQVPSKRYPNALTVLTTHGFELGEELGKGSYATVHLARRLRDGRMLACKVVELAPKHKSAAAAAKNELFILLRVSHPHIVKLYSHYMIDLHAPRSRFLYIFMQLAEGGSLSVYMRKATAGLPEPTCKRMFAQIATALAHVHSKGIAHRDLKMGNVLLDKEGDCLVSDFGLSRVAYRASKGGLLLSNRYCGTVPYMAPEILLAREHAIDYSPFKADIWALGVVLFCIVNRGYPFPEKEHMLAEQLKHTIRYSTKVSFMPNVLLRKLQASLLDPNVECRIRMDRVLAHAWLASEVRKIEASTRR